MYCGRTVGFKSCVCTVHIQVCTSGNKKLQGLESKPAKQLRPFNLVEICKNTASFAMKYCIVLSQWISERNFNFARLRVCVCFYVACLYSKREQEETALLIDRRFHFVLKQYCIFLTELPTSKRDMECFARVSILFPWKVVFLNPSTLSTQILRATACFSQVIVENLKECVIPWGSCGIPLCNILLQRGPHSFEKV